MKKLITVFIAILLFSSHANAQFTTEGTDFWFGFMHNDLTASREIFLEVYVSSREDASIRLANASGSFAVTRTITANSSVKIEVPIDFMPQTEGKTDFAMHLTADVDVSVYALNKGIFTADAAVILPTNVLGQKYYVMAHREPPGDVAPGARGSLALVVATADNTEVAITPSVTTDTGWPAGETRNFVLNQGETYQLKSENFDLTGTVMEVVDNGNICANIAVFGGNRFTNVGGCGGNRDHLYEQMYPVSTWGKRFLWVTYETRTGGDFFKVTAAEDGTVVNLSDWGIINLDEGETQTIKALTGPRIIASNKPVQIAQFSRSTECDGQVNSDPFMIMLSPLAQRITQATFDLFVVDQIDKYYITLITAPNGNRDITLDGVDITDRFQGTPGGTYASFEIERGTRTLIAPEGVIAYVYGYGANESFGYSAGVSLENLNLDIIGEDPILAADVINKQGCINSPIIFDAVFEVEPGQDPVFTQFDWHFGDGTTGTGQGAVHAYNQAGIYDVTLIASDGTSSCGGSAETITGTVTILDVDVDEPGIVGAISICPEVEGVIYTISGDSRNTYEWEVSGGEIIGDNTGTEVSVKWGLTNANAFVRVIPISGLGCRGNPLTLDVIINTRLEPGLPQGNIEVCLADLTNAGYSTPSTPGSVYEWFVEGGSVLSGAGTSEVVVTWDNTGAGRIWYREFNPAIADCEGFSEKLEVTIYPQLQVVGDISNALCFGDTDGTIALDISGGKSGPYTVNWSNNMTGADIAGLAAGTYTATIRDVLGCILEQDFVVEEPPVLAIESFVVENVRCFQENNGMITVSITGGTPKSNGDYNYAWTSNGTTRTTNVGLITGLGPGTYDLVVSDANGCSVSDSFDIIEPPLLEPDLTTLVNEPICPNASDGTAYIEVKGGTPDYQFFWSNDPTTDEQEGQNFSRGTYTVRIVDASGCETSQTIEITERYPRIFLPNAFTPNGDGENEEFKAVTDCDLNFNMQIFNEWGAIAFATTDITQGWDGNVEGQEAPIGKYSYIVFYSGTINGVSFEETLRGTLRLLR